MLLFTADDPMYMCSVQTILRMLCTWMASTCIPNPLNFRLQKTASGISLLTVSAGACDHVRLHHILLNFETEGLQ